MENASGRAARKARQATMTRNHGISETIKMEQTKPLWVFKIEVPLSLFAPPNEYNIVFRRRIRPESLLKILKGVEAEFESAFVN